MANTELLRGLIEIYENDFMCGYEGEDKEDLRIDVLELILALVKYINDFRYCNRNTCPCSPESTIKEIFDRRQQFLKRVLLLPYSLTDVNPIKIYELIERAAKGGRR